MRDLRRLSVDPGRRADIIRYNAVRGDFGPGDVDELVTERIEKSYCCGSARWRGSTETGDAC